MKKRIKFIDYIKAFACLLVVIGHLLQSLQKANIDVCTKYTSFIIWFIYLFHMPLFMCMSGYIYIRNKKINSRKEYKTFIFKKLINLGIPYLVFYLSYLGLNIFFSSSVNSPKGIEELIGIINNPMAPYWFLYALFSIFVFIPLFENIFKKPNVVMLILFIFKIISFKLNTNIYLIDSFMKNAVYFYFAIYLKETDEYSKLNKVLLSFIYIISAIIFYKVQYSFNIELSQLIKLVFSITGIFIIFNIFKDIDKCKILDRLSKYTFQIYLMHTIFGAGIRIILFKIKIDDYLVHFIFGIIFSVYIPILISKISDKLIYTNLVFFPLKTIKKVKEVKNENFISK